MVGLIQTIEKAAVAPFLDHRGYRALVYGIACSLIPLVFFISLGYVVSVFNSRLEEKKEASTPPWENPEKLFTQGVIAFALFLIFAAIPQFFAWISFSILRLGGWFILIFLPLFLIYSFLWLAAIFVIPLSMANFLRTRSFLASFEAMTISHRAEPLFKDLFKATLISLVMLLMVSLPILISPYGYLLSLPFSFVLMVFLAYLYGEILSENFSR